MTEPRNATPGVSAAPESVSQSGPVIDTPLPSPAQGDEAWERLRSLLFAREIAELEELRQRLDDPGRRAQDVSTIISEALLLRSNRDERLQAALQDTVETIIRTSMRRDPSDFASHIFPVMGPAIRRAISEAFRSMLQSFSKSLEMSFSWKGLRWRIEALRTGRPFSEIVLLHTLLYRVEQIFFIHAETGLVLDHLVNEGVETQDADLVSGMLTAVQDFVRDCFTNRDKDNALDSLQVGDYTIFVERSPRAYLAYVVRGMPPVSLRNKFREMLDVSVLECADLLNNFDGNTEGFHKLRPHFEDFLISRYVDDGKKLSFVIRYLPIAILLLVLGGSAFSYWYLKNQENTYLEAVAVLDEKPGIVVTQTIPSLFGKWSISYLYDDLADDAHEVLVEAGMPDERFRLIMTPHLSMDDSIIIKRLERSIIRPPGVTMTFNADRIVRFSGSAPQEWIIKAREKALAIPGVRDVDTSALSDPHVHHLETALTALKEEPGIVVTHVDTTRSDRWEISCLKDELAPDPEEILAAAGVPAGTFALRSSPYISLDDAIIHKRVRLAIQPPPSVQITLDKNRTLHLSGTASMGWIMAMHNKALTIFGVKDIDTTAVTDPRTQQLTELVNRVESVSIHFPVNKDTPVPEDRSKLLSSVDTLVSTEKLAREMGVAVSLVVYGHADATGQEKRNYEISQERARTLAAMLYARGSGIPITIYGMGAEHASRPGREALSHQASRRIDLRVHLSRAVTTTFDPLQDK